MADPAQYIASPSPSLSPAGGLPPAAPTRRQLPEIGWLEVANLQVDHQYQHRPYTRAIKQLQAQFAPAHSGFILVNRRADGRFFVIDGQTRRAVHELLGLRYIRAEILHGLTATEEAQIYLLKCINTQRIPVDAFLAELAAGQHPAVLLHGLLAQRHIAVESYATEHQQPHVEAVIACVKTLKDLLRRDPDGVHLGATLDLIIDTWGCHRRVLTGQFIAVMHGLVLNYGDVIDRKSFINRLALHSIEELTDRARNLRHASTTNLPLRRALQQKIADVYNKGRHRGRISLGS